MVSALSKSRLAAKDPVAVSAIDMMPIITINTYFFSFIG
jgi:hypothetical protein